MCLVSSSQSLDEVLSAVDALVLLLSLGGICSRQSLDVGLGIGVAEVTGLNTPNVSLSYLTQIDTRTITTGTYAML